MGTSELAGADKAWLRAQEAAKSQAAADTARQLAEAALAATVAVQTDIGLKAARAEAAQRAAQLARTAALQAASDSAADLASLRAQILASRPQRKIADFLALPNIPYLIDTSDGPIDISLSPDFARDDAVMIEDVAAACGVHPATLRRGGYTIDGEAADYVIETPGISILGRFDGATINIRRAV